MGGEKIDFTQGKLIGEMMSKDDNQEYEIISKGDLVMLRTLVETDRDHYQRWPTPGEWQMLDAPWEANASEEKHDKESKTKQPNTQDGSIPKKSASLEDDSIPKKRAMIATLENKSLGWVNRYAEKNNSLVWYVGIAICEDDYLNRGYGAEALKLWVNHLFANSGYHKLGLDTWSFNPRMMRVAEKVGFLFEGRLREIQFWQGAWLDLVQYGMLRDEWEKIQSFRA